jgi:hypothetical protein
VNIKRKRIIPFKLWPGAWGLKGQSRKIAEAEYYLTGYDLKERLIHIQYEGKDKKIRLLDLEKEYGRITADEYDESIARETLEDEELELRLTELAWRNKKISDREYKKAVATIKKESYIEILNVDSEGSFEFDWNRYFIEEIEAAGFGPAPKEEMIVDEWFNEICKNITIEHYQGDIALLDEQIEERQSGLVQVNEIGPGLKEVK